MAYEQLSKFRHILGSIFQASSNEELEQIYPHGGRCTSLGGCKLVCPEQNRFNNTNSCGNPLCEEFIGWIIVSCRFQSGTPELKIPIVSECCRNIKVRRSSGIIEDDWTAYFCVISPYSYVDVHSVTAMKRIPLNEFLELNPSVKFDAICIYQDDWLKFKMENRNTFLTYESNFLRE
jgi:hypothetical protein